MAGQVVPTALSEEIKEIYLVGTTIMIAIAIFIANGTVLLAC
jgi:hypothetical protein